MTHLTELETKVLNAICLELSPWRDDEPGYSCIDYTDLSNLNLPKRTLAGVLGSLTVKNLISIDSEDFKGIIYPVWENIDNSFGRQ